MIMDSGMLMMIEKRLPLPPPPPLLWGPFERKIKVHTMTTSMTEVMASLSRKREKSDGTNWCSRLSSILPNLSNCHQQFWMGTHDQFRSKTTTTWLWIMNHDSTTWLSSEWSRTLAQLLAVFSLHRGCLNWGMRYFVNTYFVIERTCLVQTSLKVHHVGLTTKWIPASYIMKTTLSPCYEKDWSW